MSEVDILGIDLGTTNSAIAIWEPDTGQARVLSNSEGDRLTPSVVMFDTETNQPIVGKSALGFITSHPSQVIYSVKRFMGCTFRDERVRIDQTQVTYTIAEMQQSKVAVRIGEGIFTPPQISAEVLRKLKEDAEATLGKTISQAVITVPAYFSESQRQATKEAGELAGLRVRRIINEPTAAALAFGLGTEPQTVAVYDLGGGTFDISILRIEHGLFRVKATSGDTHLGGDDLDLAIMSWMKKAFKQQHDVDLPIAEDNSLRSQFRKTAEIAKIALTQATEYQISIPNLFAVEKQYLGLKATLTRIELEKLVQPFINRTLDICDATLKEAKLQAKDIDQVLLVGGQTRLPAIKEALRDRYGWTINDSVNPDEAVARGAAVQGARLCGYLREEVKLWDITPLSLGIELANSKMDAIIRANEPIPVTKWRKGSQAFTTQRDGQESIRFRIYQGERPIAGDNEFIGEVVLNLATTRPAGEVRVNCMFKVDHDGILHVLAEDITTDGQPVEKTFDRFYRLTQKEVDQKLEEAKVHENEDAVTNRIFQLEEEIIRLQRVINQDKTSDNLLLETLENFKVAINSRDVNQAEELLTELKSKIIN
ncbi:Hsp70 family protein [Scytonema hofmannii FACHB-248]|uniref:Hsp70 family protein n=1 Tax=Scytonema hofmannii FACHB-248 TaxID=1842502 RepID=A0ABR8GNL0_9CYAN|nr:MULTISPECIES: Hsp70 family protein [Nostocales]MBD2604784.1 Hsp70 family protein [Scytonema hofmannii FACHB-248]